MDGIAAWCRDAEREPLVASAGIPNKVRAQSSEVGIPGLVVLVQPYEYTCREDILLSLEYNDLSPRQAKDLLKSPTPLADVFKKWDSWEDNHHMENIWNAVKACANEVVRADFIAQKDSR